MNLGHAGVNTDYLVKKAKIDGDNTRIILHVYPSTRNKDKFKWFRHPNAYLRKIWRTHTGMISGPISHHILHPIMTTGKGEARGRGHRMGEDYAIISRKVGRQLQLPSEDVEKGTKILSESGVDPDAWFFCIYARDSHYKNAPSHNYRNCEIQTLVPAIEYLTNAGGYGIRMGVSKSERLPIMNHIFEYSHSTHRSDFMDIFLAGRCRFFLGNTGGICDLARCVFHKTTALHNFAPLSPRLWKGLTDNTVFIPKLLWSDDPGRYMSLAEIYESGASEYFSTDQYARSGISIHDNTADDVLALTEEVFQRDAGSWSQSSDGEIRQTEFKKLIARYYPHELASFRIGDAFLRKYDFLL
jgi:putative glycosyltransferase (TIGR04372 family)